MLKPGKARNARQGIDFPETLDSRLDQHDVFEIDRSNLALQLRAVRRAISESAEEMEMVAIERVFVEPVSQALTRTARKLYRITKELNGLHRAVERARPPKEPERSNSKPKPRPRRKRQN